MKNRKTSSVHDSLTIKNFENRANTAIDLREKSLQNTSEFLKKSATLLKHSKINHKNIGGHPDLYFKQILRNYDYFNTEHKLKSLKIRFSVSSDSLKEIHKKLSRSKTLVDQKSKHNLKKYKRKKVKEDNKDEIVNIVKSEGFIKAKRHKNKEYEEEEAFYSPKGDFLLKASEKDLFYDAETKRNDFAFGDWNLESNAKMPEPEGEDIPEGEGEGEGEGEDMFEGTEELIQQVEEEMNEVIQDNAELESVVKAAEEEPTGGGLPIGEIASNIPDSDVMREVEECEQQCMEIYTILSELKARVGELLSKPTRTESEDKELEDKQKQLNEKMLLLEQKTRRIEILLTKSKKSAKLKKPRRYDEDMLPKVLICGMADNHVPKIIVCDDKLKGGSHRKKSQRGQCRMMQPPCRLPSPDMSVMPQFAKRLSESYNMQEKLAAENADLEGMRYKLQEDLIDKDETVESLQRKLTSLTAEMRVVVKENTVLHNKLCKLQNCPAAPCSKSEDSDQDTEPPKAMPCGKGKGTCPADVETRLQEYSETTHALEKQLNEMENEVKTMQNELLAVQKERMHLEQHRKMLAQQCNPPGCPQPICPAAPVCPQPICPQPICPQPICPPPVCPPMPSSCPAPCNPSRGAAIEMQLRELREQYNRLQDDYKGKLTEVAGLRADSEKLKGIAKECEEYRKASEDKIRELEKELKMIKNESKKFQGSKEQLVEQEQQLAVAKQRYREAKDELEEVRALVEDQQNQLDDYRNKYLQAQQQVEEQRRQIDMMELDNNRVSEQVNLEIQRVKNQFQEKLQELTPLPDILKTTQLKLQEAQQMHLLAERNNEALVRELQAYRDKAAAMANQMEKVRSDQQLGADEKITLTARLEELERRLNEMIDENDTLKVEISRLEEVAEDAEKLAQGKLHEIAQLEGEVENVREESARQVARTKDRCETVRRSMQNQISDLEKQLAQSRAQARQAQKDRDEIRQKMQAQINNLNENFEDAQMRIRNLQGHVNFLKNSYTNVFQQSEPNMLIPENVDPCNCGNNY